MNIIDIIEKENLKDDAPKFNVGDTVRVWVKIKEGDKVIINKYSGTEIKYEGEEYIIVKQSDILALVD